MNDQIKVSKLSFKDVVGAGCQIKAHIDQEVPCVEFTIKGDCEQQIMKSPPDPVLIGYEPFVQFAPKQWTEMLNRVFKEMVDLWNNKNPNDFIKEPRQEIIDDLAALFGDAVDMCQMDAADFKDASGKIWSLRQRARKLLE